MLEYLIHLSSSTSAAKEVKLFNAGQFVFNSYRDIAEPHNAEDARISARSSMATILLESAGTIIYYATYVVLVFKTVSGIFTLGRLMFVIGLMLRFRNQLQAFLGSVSQGLDQMLYVGDVMEFMEAKPQVASTPVSKPIPREITSGLEFRNVSFTYHGNLQPAVNNVSFRIGPGEIVALVGENGSGKSTIVKLITRLYDPTQGQILLDGTDVRDFPLADYRAMVTAIFQDYVKYDMSATMNIAIGNTEFCSDTNRIRTAAQRAGIARCIAKLPMGFDQILGHRFSKGVNLSGGQWQRLALARAFVREAQLVILDEPTAAVDARAEARLYDDAISLAAGRMTLLISHRLANVRSANKILVLRDGIVCEEGTHAALLNNRGEYAELFNLQARGYN